MPHADENSMTLEIRQAAVADLKPDPANARVHGEANLTAIERSLRRFGQRKPLVVDEQLTVVTGNGTLEVIRDRLGWAQCWVSIFPGSAAEARAYAIADNRTGELAEWDDQLLTDSLLQLQRLDESLLDASGYTTFDLDGLAGAADDASELLAAMPGQGLDEPATDGGERASAGRRFTPGPAAAPEPDETRALVFDLPAAVFVWATEALAKVRDDEEVDSTSAALLLLLANYTGTDPPAADLVEADESE